MITSNDLIKFARENLNGRGFAAIVQREPYVHSKTPEGVVMRNSVGGVHTLLDAVLKKIGGLMVAVGAGDADREMVDKKNRLDVPPKNPKYTLKRVFLTKGDMKGFYYGFANQTIWPLFHAVFMQPKFYDAWWKSYVRVNKKFASAIISELKNKKEAFVWINDYHFALLPRLLKKQIPSLQVGYFWHIPWPTYEFLRICPWKNELLDGLLGADFFGFHRGYHVDNFIECARNSLEVLVDQEEPKNIIYQGHTTRVADVPVGVDFDEIMEAIQIDKKISRKIFQEEFGITVSNDMILAMGIERIDYTKGIIERLKTIDKFLEMYPEFQEKFVYISIAVPSREHIADYGIYNKKISAQVDKMNRKYRKNTWQPIHFVYKSLPREELFKFYKLSDIFMVTSLDDGMNLVAKEFVICTDPGKGMLLLSRFAGAAKDLTQAMLVNPYDTRGTAQSLHEAVIMEVKEKKNRNEVMKALLKENNIYKWGIDFIRHGITLPSPNEN